MFWNKKKTPDLPVEKAVAGYDVQRLSPVSQAELDAFKQALDKAAADINAGVTVNYDNALNALGKENLVLPELIVSYWTMSKDEAKTSVFGLGGAEHLTPEFIRRRYRLRLSIAAYRNRGVLFPHEMYDYFESLTQMDESDAKAWADKL